MFKRWVSRPFFDLPFATLNRNNGQILFDLQQKKQVGTKTSSILNITEVKFQLGTEVFAQIDPLPPSPHPL